METLWNFIIDIPKNLGGLIQVISQPLEYLNISILDLLGVSAVWFIGLIIGVHIVRLFVA